MSDFPNPQLPLVQEIALPEINQVFRRFAQQPHCLFLDSALQHAELGRYSFLTADPFEIIRLSTAEAVAMPERLGIDPFTLVQQRLAQFTAPTVAGLPPFQGGAAGLFGFELMHALEKIPPAKYDDFQIPSLVIGLYDTVLAIDHQENRAWIISQGFPEMSDQLRLKRAQERIAQFKSWIDLPESQLATGVVGDPKKSNEPHAAKAADHRSLLSLDALAPQFEVPRIPGLMSTFSEAGYLQAVQQVIDYIHAGDVFQVNFTQRLLYPARESSVELYLRLRERNRATFAGYFDLDGQTQLVSASPERFLKVQNRLVETRPIKGTRRRVHRPEADLYAGFDLQSSEKDRAENIMIVDLLRNDLSQTCDPESLKVTALCKLEVYEYVQHLVSVVQGRLSPGVTVLDLLRTAFPGGSITGAPKVRAMEIITQLEPTVRSAYCGSLGYIGFDEACDTNILIRTIIASQGWWQASVGGGIVAQSDPVKEYEETWSKAAGLLRAFEP